MKRILMTAALAGLVAARLGAGGVSIKGAYVEARTAEVFAGGCVINGEAATTGREALMAWKVDRGASKASASTVSPSWPPSPAT